MSNYLREGIASVLGALRYAIDDRDNALLRIEGDTVIVPRVDRVPVPLRLDTKDAKPAIMRALQYEALDGAQWADTWLAGYFDRLSVSLAHGMDPEAPAVRAALFAIWDLAESIEGEYVTDSSGRVEWKWRDDWRAGVDIAAMLRANELYAAARATARLLVGDELYAAAAAEFKRPALTREINLDALDNVPTLPETVSTPSSATVSEPSLFDAPAEVDHGFNFGAIE